ncbi:DNA methylase [Candidatus Atribacteria bacterium HGW-Atribacteria-1]|nr:MAG: DNA methylase [Candidatus Atribacteria bacterium HGW-Atribacteria-1]
MKRFIEVSFPVKEISKESVREKNVRHGHISTLHIWWARRPLASSRATAYASLIPAPESDVEWDKKRQFIINLSKWENPLNSILIEKARKDILKANGGKPLRVLDPFAGGGAIPLEALRLGCETYAGEYNPVAVLILKCTLEYPQKYGKPKEVKEDWGLLKGSSFKNPLLEDVKRWGSWVLEEAKKEIGKFYPKEKDGSIPVGYIWVRTLFCQNPSCNAEIPLMRQFWLAKKENKKATLKPFVNDGKVEFEIVENPDFDPTKGTVSRAIATCLVCGSTVDANTTRKLFQEGRAGQKMVAVVLHHLKKQGKTYKIAKEEDFKVFKEAEKYLKEKRAKLMEEWGIDPVPDEYIDPNSVKPRTMWLYGMTKWGDLFNFRQKLALITFMEKVRLAYKKIIKEGYDEDYAKVVVSYLAVIFDRLADKNSNLVVYNVIGEKVEHVFGRQALGMVWDYVEVNPFTDVGWPNMQGWVERIIDHCSQILPITNSKLLTPTIFQSSATSLSYPDNYFDAVFTDPPYYDNINYAELSDFFYVWLKRTVGDLYPELFSTPLVPKTKEIVANPVRQGNQEKAKKFFEENLKKSFQEIYRVLKPNGIATIVYTHKSTSGWETVINSLLDSNLVITASWPINTEMQARLNAKETAALASSIYIVARKIERKETGWFNEVKEEIKKHIYQKLERLWQEGISGADFFVAAIGSSIEIFGKYEKIMDYEGKIIRADKLLDFVRDAVTDYTVRQILHNGIAGELSPLTKFYLLHRWTYQEAKVHFDDARKLAQSTGIDLAKEWNKGFIRKEKEFIRILGPQERDLKEVKNNELIDVLHQTLILWKEGKREEMKKVLANSGWGNRDAFFRVAQAISETLPIESREKKFLDGFLSGKEKILSEMKDKPIQRRLFE